MKSPVVKRSIVVGGHKTSVSLEEAFWNGMKEISHERSVTLSLLVGEIDTNRQQGNLSSAIRLFVLGCAHQAFQVVSGLATLLFRQIFGRHSDKPAGFVCSARRF